MKKTVLFALWGGLFVISAALGLADNTKAGLWVSILFFLPPSLLLYDAGKAGDKSAVLLIRNRAALSLGLTLVLLILNVVFVHGFGMNVDGVAWATTISEALSAAAILYVMTRRTDACKLDLKKLHFHRKPIEKMLRIGVPAGIQSSMFSLSNVVIQSAVNGFGSIAVSGNAAVANLEGFEYVIVNSFHQTAVNFVGQNSGAMRYDRVKKTTWLCEIYAVIFGIVTGVLMCAFAPQLLSLYITDSQEAISIGIARMYITVLPYCLFAIQDVITGVLRGLGASFISMLLSVLGICGIRILWIYTIFQIPQFHTQSVLYMSYPLSWVITFVIQLAAFLAVFRKLERRKEA